MRRVRAIHALRTAAMPAAAFFVLTFALWGIGREVWVAKVFENVSSVASVPEIVAFFANAFLDTDLLVQVLSLLAVCSLIAFARGCIRALPVLRFA